MAVERSGGVVYTLNLDRDLEAEDDMEGALNTALHRLGLRIAPRFGIRSVAEAVGLDGRARPMRSPSKPTGKRSPGQPTTSTDLLPRPLRGSQNDDSHQPQGESPQEPQTGNPLRGWGHAKTKQILAEGPRAGGPDGVRS